MSLLLLDTHMLVWFANGESRIGKAARGAINQAANSGELYLAAISTWEIAMLVAKGRLTLNKDVQQWLHEVVSRLTIKLQPLSVDIAVGSTRLPGELHGDPADRLIAATARAIGATLVTVDEKLLDYGGRGHLLVMDGAD